MAAGITWIYSDSDANAAAQTKTASGLTFSAGDRILVVGWAISAGNGSTHAMGVTDTASTNNPTWTVLGSSAYNTLSSANFPSRITAILSDELTAGETFDVTLDYQTGSANSYYGVMGVARVTGTTDTMVRFGSNIGTYGDDDALCTFSPAGSATSGNLVVMCVGHGGPAPYTYDTPPTNFAQVPGSTSTTTGNAGLSAISSITTTASSVAWGYEPVTNDAEFMAALAFELAAAAGGGVEEGTGALAYGGTVAATGTPVRLGVGAATYGGTVAATGTIPTDSVEGTGSLAYGGVVASSGLATRLGTATATYGGTVAGTGTASEVGTAGLTYGGVVAGAGQVTRLGTGALGYGGTVAGTGVPIEVGTAGLTYGGGVAGSGLVTHLGTAVLAYGGTLAGAGVIPTGAVLGTGTLSYGGTVAATGQVQHLGTGTVAYGGTVAATGTIPTDAVLGTAVVAYGGVVAATGTAVRLGSGTLGYGGLVVGGGVPVEGGGGVVGYGGQVAGAGLVVHLGTVVLAYGGTVVYVEPGAGWGWSLRRSGTLQPTTARVSRGGTLHPTTATVT